MLSKRVSQLICVDAGRGRDEGTGATTTPAPDFWVRARFLLELHRQGGKDSCIVAIQRGTVRPPLFLVHGAGGGMFWGYTNLSRALGPDQPVYVFKSIGMEGGDEFTTIEAMAAHYVSELLKFQPTGAFCLGGYCFGANVAFEMARQLKAQGRPTALVLLMNCWPHNSSYTKVKCTPTFFVKFLRNLLLRLRLQIFHFFRSPRYYFKWRAAWLWRRLSSFCSKRTEDRVIADRIEDLFPGSCANRRLWRTHVRAWLQYIPQRYGGKVLLLRTRGHPLVCSFDPQMGWGNLVTSGVSVRICRGDHESILDSENVLDAARHIKAALDQIQAQPPEDHQAEWNNGQEPALGIISSSQF
ncbi:MAG TPA: thioesterase domain-containing protein [Verrucomicrobiae bacterium]|nr:thioesterase domain-containing protein [Verrucomicrobiae bacterium]